MSILHLSPLWTSTQGRRGEEGGVRDRNTEWEGEMDRLMECKAKKNERTDFATLLRHQLTSSSQRFILILFSRMCTFPLTSHQPIACFPFLLLLMAPQL